MGTDADAICMPAKGDQDYANLAEQQHRQD
jgi:hypothetical protein